MKNIYTLLALTYAIFNGSTAFAGLVNVKVNVTAAVQTCTGGQQISCTQVVNAIGDPIQIPLNQLNVQQLDISKSNQSIHLPVVPGTRTAYSFSPSQGDLTGKTIYLVFDNVAQRPGTKDFNKLVIKMYRHVKEVDAVNQWFEVGSIAVDKLAWEFPTQPDGTFISQDSRFSLGKQAIENLQK